MYAVFHTRRFDKELIKQFSQQEQKEIQELEKKQLVSNPYVGDPLGYPFFREKKIGGKRVYYLIYDDLQVVLLVAVSDKKAQQETIDEIREHLDEYHDVVKESMQRGEYGRT